MTRLNAGKATARLQQFLSVARVTYVAPGGGYIGSGTWRLDNPESVVQRDAQVVEPLLDAILPGWRTAPWEGERTSYWRHREAANRAIAALESADEIAEVLGDSAPEMSAGSMHAWVWDSAKALWGSGHYRDAVSAAARGINAQAQTKVGRRDLSEWKLLTDCFALKAPEPGKPRLRLMAADGSDTFTTMHEGAGAYARGLYQGIRNPANHDQLPELSEGEGLEQLAAFSVLARWVDGATVETI